MRAQRRSCWRSRKRPAFGTIRSPPASRCCKRWPRRRPGAAGQRRRKRVQPRNTCGRRCDGLAQHHWRCAERRAGSGVRADRARPLIRRCAVRQKHTPPLGSPAPACPWTTRAHHRERARLLADRQHRIDHRLDPAVGGRGGHQGALRPRRQAAKRPCVYFSQRKLVTGRRKPAPQRGLSDRTPLNRTSAAAAGRGWPAPASAPPSRTRGGTRRPFHR